MSSNLDPRLTAIFARILHISADRLHEGIRRGELEEWDSLGHLELVHALMEELHIEISPEEALDLETIADIEQLLVKKDGAAK